MNNNNDNEMIACAQSLRAAVNNECEVAVTRRVAITNYNSAPIYDWCIYTGDILNKGNGNGSAQLARRCKAPSMPLSPKL